MIGRLLTESGSGRLLDEVMGVRSDVATLATEVRHTTAEVVKVAASTEAAHRRIDSVNVTLAERNGATAAERRYLLLLGAVAGSVVSIVAAVAAAVVAA